MKRHSILQLSIIIGPVLLMFAAIVVAPAPAQAQSGAKVGIVNFDEIISKLPEFKQIEGEL